MDVLVERIRQFEEDEAESRTILSDLKQQLMEAEDVRARLEARIGQQMDELDYLRSKLGADKGFQRYVEVLRELNQAKDLNEVLQLKLNELYRTAPMTTLSSNGRVKFTSAPHTIKQETRISEA